MLSVFRRSASFLFVLFVARMKRSEIRGGIRTERSFPDCAALHPGYERPSLIVMKAGPTAGASDEDRALTFVLGLAWHNSGEKMRRENGLVFSLSRPRERSRAMRCG